MNRLDHISTASGARRTRKAVLSCPDCGHESPPDGDWTVAEERRNGRPHDVYRCPDCDATVTDRRRFALP
ncbi:hypothetical protein [Halostella salina]|uniref:hypothetical protein n=1 Tax=Halostella salina TaxID=1547897 RepID=UPI000EF84EBA|nr:hypothetical protein [Halostella salina]